MKNNIKRIGIGVGAIVVLLGARVVFSEPGSSSDPLVTLSYVENKVEQLKYYIDSKIGDVSSNPVNNLQASWEVVEVPAGKSLICKDGTEIILRSGRATAIAVEKNGIINGLTDITAGKDLGIDELILANHLLIVPRNDGRGAKAITHCFFLVKGDYEIR